MKLATSSLKNATEMLDRVLQRHGRAVREAARAVRAAWVARAAAAPTSEVVEEVVEKVMEPSRDELLKQENRARQLARYEEASELRRQGVSLRAIARRLRLSRNTVAKYVRADSFQERRPAPARTSIIDPFAEYLAARWGEGCRSSMQLWRELRERGFTGQHSGLWQYLRRWRAEVSACLQRERCAPVVSGRPPRTTALAPRAAAWLLQQDEADLQPDERTFATHLQESAPEVGAAARLVRRFREIVRARRPDDLDSWLADAQLDALAEVRNFAAALRRDYKAVRAALEHGWSQGQVEGQVNRLKTIKRAMYGRANLDLLRARVLHT